MDKAALIRVLAMVHRHIAKSARHAFEAETGLFDLEHAGHNLINEQAFLASVRVIQSLHTEHRDRI